METLRKPFQGVLNIIRFNWHFYVLAFFSVALLFCLSFYVARPLAMVGYILSMLITLAVVVSLIASYYIYDCSSLYQLNWVTAQTKEQLIVNIHAGFDETSALLQAKFTNATLKVFDFYQPDKHTEISIKRARAAYPPYPQTVAITTDAIPLASRSADAVFLILAAHEIRNDTERILFFKEIHRIVKPDGKVYVTEHCRDWPNFMVYHLGFFHFLSKQTWYKTFSAAQFTLKNVIKTTPFISTFILEKNDYPH